MHMCSYAHLLPKDDEAFERYNDFSSKRLDEVFYCIVQPFSPLYLNHDYYHTSSFLFAILCLEFLASIKDCGASNSFLKQLCLRHLHNFHCT